MNRRRIQPDEKVAIPMTSRDRELLLEHTLGAPEYAARLRPASTGNGLVGEYALDDLEDILGYVADRQADQPSQQMPPPARPPRRVGGGEVGGLRLGGGDVLVRLF